MGSDPDADKLVVTTAVPVDDQFSIPKQIRWSAALGKLLVCSHSNWTLHVRNPDLSFFTKHGTPISISIDGLDSDLSNIYFSSDATNKLYKSTYTSPYDPGTFLAINSIHMIDASGDPDYIYVTSNNAADGHGVRKVRKSDMTVVASILATGAGNGQFNNPFGVKYYGGYVYVCDYTNQRIVKLNASDLTVATQSARSGAVFYDIDTDGTNWYICAGAGIYKTDFAFANSSYVVCVSYSLCIIPDQGDGYEATLAIVDSTNNHLERRKCSDLSAINSVGSLGDGSSSLYDPTFNTTIDTYIDFTTDDGQSGTMVRTGSAGAYTHAHSLNGFAAIFFKTAGPHVVKYRARGGLRLVTVVDLQADAITLVKGISKCNRMINIANYSNTYAIPLSDLASTVTIIGGETFTGDLSSLLNKQIKIQPVFRQSPISGSIAGFSVATIFTLFSNVNVTGSLTDLGVLLQTGYFYGDIGITAASIAHLVAIRDLRIYSMGWLTADVDLVLMSVSEAILVNPAHFTYATPSLQIGGTNQAPSGIYQAPSGVGGHAVSGLEAIYAMVHNTGNAWSVTCTGSGPYTP
jgi:hypothetical protein